MLEACGVSAYQQLSVPLFFITGNLADMAQILVHKMSVLAMQPQLEGMLLVRLRPLTYNCVRPLTGHMGPIESGIHVLVGAGLVVSLQSAQIGHHWILVRYSATRQDSAHRPSPPGFASFKRLSSTSISPE